MVSEETLTFCRILRHGKTLHTIGPQHFAIWCLTTLSENPLIVPLLEIYPQDLKLGSLIRQ